MSVMLLRLLDNPDVWTDGSLVLGDVSGASFWFWVFYVHLPGQSWRSRRWSHLDDIGSVGGLAASCGGFCSVAGPRQTTKCRALGSCSCPAGV